MPSLAVGWRLAMVWLWFQSGQIEKASAIFSEQAPKPAQIPFDTVWLQAVAQLGDSAVYVGDVGLAEECYRLLLPYAERFWYSGSHDIGYLARYLCRMAALLDRRDEADAHLRYSLHMHTRRASRSGRRAPPSTWPSWRRATGWEGCRSPRGAGADGGGPTIAANFPFTGLLDSTRLSTS